MWKKMFYQFIGCAAHDVRTVEKLREKRTFLRRALIRENEEGEKIFVRFNERSMKLMALENLT